MTSKDLIYIGLIAGVGYLFLKNQKNKTTLATSSNLDQPLSMDLPNLTANQGQDTEESLKENNITPISNEPQQLFGLPLLSGISPVFSATITPTTPLTTTPTTPTKTSDTIQNISPCGNSFSVRLNDRDNSVINYWYDGNYYYQQTTSNLMRSVAVRITFQQYNDACSSSMNSLETTPKKL